MKVKEARRTGKVVDIAIAVVAIAMSIYHLSYTQYLIVGAVEHVNLHYALGFTLVFLLALKKRPRLQWLILAAILLLLVGTFYVGYFQEDLQFRVGHPITPDLAIGTILVILALVACWESFGPVLPTIAIIFVTYFQFGQYLPKFIYHYPFPFGEVISRICIGMDGMYGVSGSISANFIFLFILFGGILQVSGAIDFFLELGKAVGRKLRGGPAQAAVVSSLLVGSVTGSAMANVGITGAYTIPLMKRVGYTPEQAGAIEASASSGGQVMPPIMGASAFMLVGITGIVYIHVMAAAIIPAILFFLAIAFYCEFRARALGITPLMEKIDTRLMITRAYLFIVPLVLLIYLMVRGLSPMYAIFWAIITLIVLSFVRKETRPSLRKLAQGFISGASTGARIGAACAVVGIILATVTGTGLGIKLSSAVVNLSLGNLVLLCVLAMLASIILGMGVPTLGAYLLVAVLIAPAIVKLGVPLLQAHLFCLYFAIFSGITPPVALAALVGAGMAGANYFKTSVEAWKISLPAYIIAYVLIWNPTLVANPPSPLIAVLTFIAIIVGIATIAMVVTSQYLTRLNWLEMAITILSGAGLIGYCFTMNNLLFALGAGFFTALTLWQVKRRGAEAKVLGATDG